MTPDELLALMDREDLIPGIYNYCDRWCERCPMTFRCLTFLTLQAEDDEDPVSNESNEVQEKDFLKKIKGSLDMTFMLIEKMTKEQNIDLSVTDDEIDSRWKEREVRRKAMKNTTLSHLAWQDE